MLFVISPSQHVFKAGVQQAREGAGVQQVRKGAGVQQAREGWVLVLLSFSLVWIYPERKN